MLIGPALRVLQRNPVTRGEEETDRQIDELEATYGDRDSPEFKAALQRLMDGDEPTVTYYSGAGPAGETT